MVKEFVIKMFKNFGKFTFLKYGLSLKKDGPMKINLNLDNRVEFLNRQGLVGWPTVAPVQSHSTRVEVVSNDSLGINADSVITKQTGLVLTLTASDCFPVYFFDEQSHTIAIGHCGWRGIVEGVLSSTLKSMASDPKNILVGIGPGIQECHFEVKQDVVDKFHNYSNSVLKKEGKFYIDLPKVITEQLKALDVPGTNIEIAGQCTYCQDQDYFSFRRDKPKEVQPMMAFIGLSS